MIPNRAAIAALALLALPIHVVAQEATLLSPGIVIDRTMSAGETHEYPFDLDADQFVYLVVQQRGIDVMIVVTGPDGETIREFDSPNGSLGPEAVSFTTEIAGTYGIEVRPFDEKPDPGEYTLSVLRAEASATTPEGRVDQLFTPWDRDDGPGAAIAVARNGEIVYENGYGLANLEYDIPITPQTIFHVASVSKQFTAFAIVMLADRGELSLDDDIRLYLPEVPDFGDTITIRHLLHHTSGLRDQWALLAMAGWRLDDVITTDHILQMVARQQELNFEPGSEELYSNTGYTLLAEIVARVSGQSFPDWTEENLFEPLGMTRTHFHDDHEMIVPGRAYSYQADSEDGFRKSVLSYANAGATSLFTTVEDLTYWLHNLDTGEVGGAAVVAQMHERGVLNDGDTISYALALVIGEHRGIRTVSHGGADAGFRTEARRFPDQDLSVVVLSNEASFNPYRMSLDVADIYLADEIARLAEQMADADGPDADAPLPGEPVAIEMDPAVFADYEGDYQLQPGLILGVYRDGDALWIRPSGSDPAELFPEAEDSFFITVADVRITFVRASDGTVTALVVHQGDENTEAPRIEPYHPTPEDLAEFEGEYWSPELLSGYRLKIEHGALVAYHQRNLPVHLDAIAEDEFTGDAWFFGGIEFDRDDAGAVVGMRVSNGRVRNLSFERQ